MSNDYGTFLDSETLKFERILPGPIEMVWKCLTESEHKAKWLAGGDVEPSIGGKVTHHFDHRNLSDKPEALPQKYKDSDAVSTSHGKVLEWDAYNLLSYTWDEGDDGVSQVRFELTELDNGKVKLVLIHTHIPDSKGFKTGVSAGWHTHLNILRDILKGNSPAGFWSVHMPLEAEYEKIIE